MDSQFDHAPCGFLSFADDRTILQVNATLGEWLGYEPRELIGQSLESILSIGGRIFCQTHIFPLLKLEGQVEEIYFSLQTRRREAFAVLTSACRREVDAVFVNDCIFLPMRQRRQYEDELPQARKTADEASQAKAKFLSMMSHELRTPMNAILGFGQLLQMDELQPKQSEQLAHILKAGKHLLGLINEVLDISRIEAGHPDLAPEAIPAARAMKEVFEMARPLAVPLGIHLHLLTEPRDDCEVYADRGRLRQILLNLLANGIKYNRAGGSVTLSCQPGTIRTGTEKQGWRFVVQDTGLGIAPDKLGKLFVPFERLGAETGVVEGTGLGLSLCKRLVEAMQGQIGVSSVPGEGSSFWVELPLATGSGVPVIESVAPRERAEPVGRDSAADSLLLYIEDNPSNLALVQEIFASRPAVQLLTAATGEAGLALAHSATPELILLDLQLPDVTGETVLERLRADQRTCAIPVIVLSVDATPRQIAHLLQAGAQDYLTKPLDVRRFLSAVDAVLDKEKGAVPLCA